jgi:hypothetical protein
MDLDAQLDREVTIEGTAENGAAGAIVRVVDRTPIYLDGLARWNCAAGTAVRVTGVLRKRAGDRVVDDRGQHGHGIPSARYVLERPHTIAMPVR